MRVVAASVIVLGLVSLPTFAEEKPAEKITFDQHIVPIFREKCGSCHNANDKKGDLVLDNYGLAMQGGASGEVVKTDGDASQSQLYLVIAHLSEPKMPPNQPKLPEEQIALVKKWIEGGALENSGSKAKAKKNIAVARVEVSNQRPAGPPPMPENYPLDPALSASRGNGVTALATNPWSPLVAVAGHKQIVLYDTRNRDLVGVLPFPEGVPHILKFSRNGQWLMAGGGRGGQSGKVVLFEVTTGKRIAEVGNEYDVVLAADISPDHTQVALGGPKKIVRVYDTTTGELLYEKNKHTDWITAIEFSPDGVLLATGDRSNGLIVWEAFTGREFYILTGHTAAVTDVSWSPDSNVLASASEDTTIRLWEMQNGGQIKSFGAHGGGVSAIEFTRASQIVSTGRDNVAKLWDLNGATIRAFPGLADIGMEVAYDAETDLVLAGDLIGNVTVWNGKDAAVVGQLNTNPPTLAVQLQSTTTNLAAAETAAAQAAAALAALTKTLADRKAVAADATAQAAAAATEFDLVNKVKVLIDADVAAKAQVLQGADTNVANNLAAQVKATADRDAVVKNLADLRAKLKAATDAVVVAEADASKSLAAYEAKLDDENLKNASAADSKKLADAHLAVSELNKQIAAAVQDHTAKTQGIAVSIAAVNVAKAARDKVAADKAGADDTLAKYAPTHKAKMDLAANTKAAADKANAEATITPELQKQLADTESAAKSTSERLASLKSRLDRLNAAKSRPAQPPEGNAVTELTK